MDDDFSCRRCGKPMQRGHIYSGRWVRWLPQGAKAPRGYGQLGHEELLGVSWTRFRPPTAHARRCSACRLVEFDY